MPVNPTPPAISEPAAQRVSILKQLARGGMAQPGDAPLPELNDPSEAPADAGASPHKGVGKLANLMYFGGLGSDIATTAIGAHNGLKETNPLLKFAGTKAAAPLVAGGGIVTYLIAKKLLGDKHPDILKALMMGMGGVHGAAAVSNVHQMGNTPPGAAQVGTPSNEPPFPGAVRQPDGSWINPDYFPK